jgi:membrane protease YdiL (CAAX protease family)
VGCGSQGNFVSDKNKQREFRFLKANGYDKVRGDRLAQKRLSHARGFAAYMVWTMALIDPSTVVSCIRSELARGRIMVLNLSDAAKAALFYVIALSLAGAIAATTSTWGASTPHVTMLTPAAAVLVMMLLVTDDGRHRAAWTSLDLHKAGLNGWPFAIMVPTLVLGGTYAVTWVSGLAEIHAPVTNGLLKFVVVALLGLAFSTFFAMGEEIGWRGYMLPRLKTLGVFRAMLVVGFLQGVWHLPIMLATPWYHSSGSKFIVVPLFLVTLTLAGVLFGYLRFTTGSVWPCAIAHAVYNVAWDTLTGITAASSPETLEYVAGESGILPILELSVVAAWILSARRTTVISASGYTSGESTASAKSRR